MKQITAVFFVIIFIINTFVCTLIPVSAQDVYMPFADVKAGSWYEKSLMYCYEHGYMKGTASDKFSPNAYLTRAMTVQMLYSINDVAPTEPQSIFGDVAPEHWFYNAVEWAYENNIVSGTGEGIFSPMRNVTRQDFYVILYNYSALYSHYDNTEINDNYLYFDDNNDISDYALEAMNWAGCHGFLSGYKDNTVRPSGTMTRAEITSVMKRFDDTLGHRWTIKSAKSATCTEKGYSAYICRDCPTFKNVSYDIIPHSWAVASLTAATCLKKGSCSYTCEGCGAQKSEDIPPKGHTWYVFAQHNGTCTTKGSCEYRCTECTAIKSEPTVYGDHSFIATDIIKPTRLKGGYTVYTCEYCGGTNHRDNTPALGRTVGWDSNYDGKLTIDEYFGAYGIVDFLTEHKYDYVGTPYVGLSTYLNKPWMLIRDKGLYPKSAGMNCTGFVASVINRCGGSLSRVSNTGKGHYANAYNWQLTATRNNIFHYTFPTISAALKSGLLKKGYIFIFMPEAKDSNPNDGLDPDYHLGIFWGDTSSHDLFWHSTGATQYNYGYGVRGLKNQITRISSGTPYSCIWVFPLQDEN